MEWSGFVFVVLFGSEDEVRLGVKSRAGGEQILCPSLRDTA